MSVAAFRRAFGVCIRVAAVLVALFFVFFALLVALWLMNNGACNTRALCGRNLERLYSALQDYQMDHQGRLPTANSAAEIFAELIAAGYLSGGIQRYSETPVYVCPGAQSDVQAWTETHALTARTCSYEIVAGVDFHSPPDFILAFDKAPNNHPQYTPWHVFHERNVLLVGSYMPIGCTEEDFERRMAWQREMMKRLKEGDKYIPFDAWQPDPD